MFALEVRLPDLIRQILHLLDHLRCQDNTPAKPDLTAILHNGANIPNYHIVQVLQTHTIVKDLILTTLHLCQVEVHTVCRGLELLTAIDHHMVLRRMNQGEDTSLLMFLLILLAILGGHIFIEVEVRRRNLPTEVHLMVVKVVH